MTEISAKERILGHIENVRDWLGRAEEGYESGASMQGELNLNLAQAELKKAWEESRSMHTGAQVVEFPVVRREVPDVSWQRKSIIRLSKHRAGLVAAVVLFLVVGLTPFIFQGLEVANISSSDKHPSGVSQSHNEDQRVALEIRIPGSERLKTPLHEQAEYATEMETARENAAQTASSADDLFNGSATATRKAQTRRGEDSTGQSVVMQYSTRRDTATRSTAMDDTTADYTKTRVSPIKFVGLPGARTQSTVAHNAMGQSGFASDGGAPKDAVQTSAARPAVGQTLANQSVSYETHKSSQSVADFETIQIAAIQSGQVRDNVLHYQVAQAAAGSGDAARGSAAKDVATLGSVSFATTKAGVKVTDNSTASRSTIASNAYKALLAYNDSNDRPVKKLPGEVKARPEDIRNALSDNHSQLITRENVTAASTHSVDQYSAANRTAEAKTASAANAHAAGYDVDALVNLAEEVLYTTRH